MKGISKILKNKPNKPIFNFNKLIRRGKEEYDSIRTVYYLPAEEHEPPKDEEIVRI